MDIAKELETLYPNKIIKKFRTDNPKLYQRCMVKAKSKELMIHEYLEELGFYYKRNGKNTHEDIKSQLSRLFPDGVVPGLRTDHRKLYCLCSNAAKVQNIHIEEYLRKLGFIYKTEGKVRKAQIVSHLEKCYPDKFVVNFHVSDLRIYRAVVWRANKEGLTLEQYLSELGFKYIKNPANKSLYSRKTLEEIKEILTLHYPDKMVKRLSKKNKYLYIELYRRAVNKGMTLREFIVDMGFHMA